MSKENHVPKRRRTLAQIDVAIHDAFAHMVSKNGFNNISLRQLLKDADVNPNVFYKRYGSIEEYASEAVKKYDLWLNETLNIASINTLGKRKYYSWALKSFFSSLKKDDFMKHLILWELNEDNDITRRSASVREALNMSTLMYYNQYFKDSGVNIQAISAIIFAGLTFLTLRTKHPTYCNLDLNSLEAEQAIDEAIDELGNLLFDACEKTNHIHQSVLKMQKDGIAPAKICDYLNISESRYKRLLSMK